MTKRIQIAVINPNADSCPPDKRQNISGLFKELAYMERVGGDNYFHVRFDIPEDKRQEVELAAQAIGYTVSGELTEIESRRLPLEGFTISLG